MLAGRLVIVAKILAVAVLLALVPPLARAVDATDPALPPYAMQFDPARDPVADLASAKRAAAGAGHNVLVIVGGDWCVWCFLLDRHLRLDPAAARTLYRGFEVLRVYYGDDNTNQAFLAPFPAFETFPHFFVVSPQGRVLASVNADHFIRDAKYDDARLAEFAARWSAAPAAAP